MSKKQENEAISGEVATKQESVLTNDKPKETASERFTNMVLMEATAILGENAVIPTFQKRLIQNNFIAADMALKSAETNRLKKPESNRDSLPVTWANININKLAIDVMVYSSLGLDPTQNNHITPIIYKNNNTNKYDVNFMMGYKGIELKAKKYGLEIPDMVTVELVYSSDVFVPIKKDQTNEVETYDFKINNAFNRGEIVGGFWYHKFIKTPEKNKLRIFSLADIEKRKPKYASAEFWGGEKDKYENGKKVGKEQVGGWFEEMAHKTIYRDAYNKITIDANKIDENYQRLVSLEQDSRENEILNDIATTSNTRPLEFTEAEVMVEVPNLIAEKVETKVEAVDVKEPVVVKEEPKTNNPQMSILDAEPIGNDEKPSWG